MKTKINKLDPSSISIAADNIAWGAANKATWTVIGAAKLQYAENVNMLERPKFEEIFLVDGVRAALTTAANIINGAELDGISTDLLDTKMQAQMDSAFVSDAKAITKIDTTNYRDPAVGELAQELGMDFLKLSKEEKIPLVAKRCNEMRVDAQASLENARVARLEYRDIAEYFARCLTNAPDAAHSITGNQDVEDYLAVRERAVQTRLKSLKSNSTMIDGEWKNRYDNRNGRANQSVISELEGHFTVLLNDAIKVGIDVSESEGQPTQADIDGVIAELSTA